MTDQLGGELTLWGEPEPVEAPPAESEKTPEEPVEPLAPAGSGEAPEEPERPASAEAAEDPVAEDSSGAVESDEAPAFAEEPVEPSMPAASRDAPELPGAAPVPPRPAGPPEEPEFPDVAALPGEPAPSRVAEGSVVESEEDPVIQVAVPPADPLDDSPEMSTSQEVSSEDAGTFAGQSDVLRTADRPAWPPLVAGEAALAQLEAAVAAPVHAYLLVGAPGNDKRAVARVFAAELLAAAGAPEGPEGVQRHRDRALRGVHRDVLMVEPEGRALLAADAASIITEAARQPVEGTRKVIICDRFHTASQGVAASLLKTIEEPPAGTLIVLLADHLPPGHATVASRCVTIRLRTPSSEEVQEWLVATGGSPDLARRAARAAAGDLARARDLLTDDGLTRRFEAWWAVPDRLDGTGARTATLVDELRGLIDAAEAAPAAAEADEPVDRTEDQRRRRQRRRVRDAELRFGFAVLAERYREALHPTVGGPSAPSVTPPAPSVAPPSAEPPAVTPGQAGESIDRLRAAAAALVRNPNEKLLLQDLLTHLPTPRP